MTKQDLRDYMDSYRLAVLATVNPANTPESALVGFAVTPELELIFDTVKTSRKYQNLSANRRIAFVFGGRDEITLQYEGEAEELPAQGGSPYKQIYFEKWPECREHETWPDIAYFVVRPKWIRYSDYDTHTIREFAF